MSVFNLPKEQYIGTIASIALLVDITRIPIYFGQGFLDPEHIRYIPILFVIAFVWSWIGKQLVKVLPQEVFRKIILGGVMVLSVFLILQGLSA
jgi:hypothetical protein